MTKSVASLLSAHHVNNVWHKLALTRRCPSLNLISASPQLSFTQPAALHLQLENILMLQQTDTTQKVILQTVPPTTLCSPFQFPESFCAPDIVTCFTPYHQTIPHAFPKAVAQLSIKYNTNIAACHHSLLTFN
jgi:hypothetical protein